MRAGLFGGVAHLLMLLPGLNEYFASFDNIGHNAPFDLILLWIVPK